MSKQYANPLFGVEQCVTLGPTGALNGTVAATDIGRLRANTATVVSKVFATYLAGGTAATRQILFGKSLAGTGAFSGMGTAVLGTQATGTIKDLSFAGTFAAGDDIYFQQLGTDAIVYNVQFQVFYREQFVNA
jgi:hypothetical protein